MSTGAKAEVVESEVRDQSSKPAPVLDEGDAALVRRPPVDFNDHTVDEAVRVHSPAGAWRAKLRPSGSQPPRPARRKQHSLPMRLRAVGDHVEHAPQSRGPAPSPRHDRRRSASSQRRSRRASWTTCMTVASEWWAAMSTMTSDTARTGNPSTMRADGISGVRRRRTPRSRRGARSAGTTASTSRSGGNPLSPRMRPAPTPVRAIGGPAESTTAHNTPRDSSRLLADA